MVNPAVRVYPVANGMRIPWLFAEHHKQNPESDHPSNTGFPQVLLCLFFSVEHIVLTDASAQKNMRALTTTTAFSCQIDTIIYNGFIYDYFSVPSTRLAQFGRAQDF